MSNNAPDYVENLAFEPKKRLEDKSISEILSDLEKRMIIADVLIKDMKKIREEESTKKKLEHSEKMRDNSAEYIQRLEEKLESTLSRAIQAENKLSREKMNKEACLSLLLKIDDWFVGMLETMNNECSEHNKSLPIGNFEQALKYEHSTIEQLVKNIKE